MVRSFNHRTSRCAVLLGVIVLIPGCHWGQQLTSRSPAVTTRFTSSPMIPGPDGTMIAGPRQQPTNVGLAMQCSPDPSHMAFSSQLGTVLMRELQLSAGSFRITPLAAIDLQTAIPALEVNDTSEVITVSLQEPANTLPPHLPPSPHLDPATPPIVDQILVARLIEYRAYYPMIATLELRVLNGHDQSEMFNTTVSWSGDDYRLCGDCSESKKHSWFCHDPSCDPGPGHNSPQALMHLIAQDVTAWYCTSNDPLSAQCIVVADSDSSGNESSSGEEKESDDERITVDESDSATKSSRWKMPKFASFRKKEGSQKPSQIEKSTSEQSKTSQ